MRRALVSTMVVLGSLAAAPGAASFAGADGRIVLSSGRDLLTVLPDGSAPQALTTTPGVEEAQASWSPDGSRVAFRVGTAGTSDVLQVAVMNADGSGRTVLTSGDHHSSQPSWSPDGRQIVFRRSVPGADLSGDIWIMGADGSSPRPLTALPGDERYPSLSPDGTRLAFTTHPTADDVEIAVARMDGGGVSAITDNAVFDSSPSWSPDGRRIAFERGPAGDDPGNDVWSMAADGTDQRRLTTSAGLDEGPASSRGSAARSRAGSMPACGSIASRPRGCGSRRASPSGARAARSAPRERPRSRSGSPVAHVRGWPPSSVPGSRSRSPRTPAAGARAPSAA